MESRFRSLFLKTMTSFRCNLKMLCRIYSAAMLVTGLMLKQLPVFAADELLIDPVSDQEQIIKPEIERREIKVPEIDTEDFEIGVYAGLMSVEDFGTNAVIGFRLAYHVTEGAFFEAAYGSMDTEETSYEQLSGAAQLLTDDERKLSYYNVSIGYNLLPGESFIGSNHAFNSSLYVIAGVGSTDFAGDNRFTMNYGAGYRLLATDWLALHADMRDHIFKNDVLGTDKTTHNIELHAGLTFFF